MEEKKLMRRPAIRSGMGIWNYYVSSMTFSQIAEYVKMPDEIYKSKRLSDMIQRTVTDNVGEIVEYIEKVQERFFNSLVLAVYDGDPQWYEGEFEFKDEVFYNIGVLEFDKASGVQIFPVDGQHRVQAIKNIVEAGGGNSEEEIPVIFITHRNNEEGIKRTRRLFTTLNRYAKPVKINEIVALDEDDIVAIVTRELVEDGGVFKDNTIDFSKDESTSDSDQNSFTNLITLYKCNEYLLNSFLKDKSINVKPKKYQRYRKNDEIIKEFNKYCTDYWNSFISCNKDISQFFDEKASTIIRRKDGGSLLFRPAGLKAYVEATSIIHIKSGLDFTKIFNYLKKVDYDLASSPWKKVLWDDATGNMIMNNKVLIENFLFYIFNNRTKQNLVEFKVDDMYKKYASLLNWDEKTDRDKMDDNILQKNKKQ